MMAQSNEPAEQAVARLYEQYHQPILRYLERLCANHELAEDLTQETFLKALRNWDQLVTADAAVAWLFRIARHAAFDEHRRLRHRPGISLNDVHLDTLAARRMELDIEDLEPIRLALGQLHAHSRHALLLHSYAGYRIEDIAAGLGWKVGTVKSRLSRARAQFRRHYAG